MLAAYCGEAQLCLNVYDNASSLARLADKFAELYIRTARRDFSLRTSWRGGSVSNWGLFAPGGLLDYQIDASNLMSARMYEQQFLECDQRIINNFEYSIVHVHACGVDVVESLLKLEHLRAIELSLDRETGQTDMSAITDIAKKIQDGGKAVLIYGELSEAELSMCTRRLSPNGLAIFYWHTKESRSFSRP